MPVMKLGYWPVPGKPHTFYFGYGSEQVAVAGDGELLPVKSDAVHFDDPEYHELGGGDA